MMPGHRAGTTRNVLLLVVGVLLAGGAVALAVGALRSEGASEAAARPGAVTPTGAATLPGPRASVPSASGVEDPVDPSAGPARPREGAGAGPASSSHGERTASERTADGASRRAADAASDPTFPSEPASTPGDDAPDAEGRPALVAGTEQSGPDAAAILARAEVRYADLASLRARFRQTIVVPLMDRRREGHGIWYQMGRDRFRMEFLEPPDDEIVADGTHLWLYYPSTNPKQVIKTSLESGSTEAGTADVLARILEEARSAYASAYVGREDVEASETHLISLRPLDPASPYRRVRVWVGVEDDLVRRFEITEANETVRTVTLTRLEPDAEIPPEAFRFTPPADADVFER